MWKWSFRIVVGLVVTLIVLAVLAWFNRMQILVALLHNDDFVEWASTFPPSEDYNSSVEGSYPVAACQNSHANWGEIHRQTTVLDGLWEVEEGSLSDDIPNAFGHTVPVPGLMTDAEPKFTEVGIESDQRDAFWYRTRFVAPEGPEAQAFLCLHKAAYGIKVWLNGEALGEHFGPSSLSEYDASGTIKYGEENELVVRLGADRSQIPSFVPAGDDDEIERWYPGIWDSVSLVTTGPVSIANVKVEANIDTGTAIVRTVLFNSTEEPQTGSLSQQVSLWQSDTDPVFGDETEVTLDPGVQTTVVQTVNLEDFELWSPETPTLYLAKTSFDLQADGGAFLPSDDRATRFGMRKVEWRSGDDKGFYLNNKLYYLRGTNIALHRFFGDAERAQLPWDEAWVRQLLTGHPKDFHWNSFRTHNGRLPNFWYDIADETGFLIADEYSLWSFARGSESEDWSIVELEKEFRGWIQENWNHASIGWWDAANENHNPISAEVIRRVRDSDPTRQWENGGYEAPVGPNDPIEEHPYKLNSGGALNLNDKAYTLEDFSTIDGQPPQATWGLFATYDEALDHPFINNEYAFLWITSLGRPTELAQSSFDNLTGGKELTPAEYREAYAYVLAELSAYWRAMRGYAGVQHFVYLSKCNDVDDLPDDWEVRTSSQTCDSFLDVAALELEPRWQTYAADVFAPQLVYLKEWRDEAYPRGGKAEIPIVVLSDSYEPVEADVRIHIMGLDGETLSRSEAIRVTLDPLERREMSVTLKIPDEQAFIVFAELSSPTGAFDTVWSRRKIGVEHPGVAITDPVSEQ
ncbi:MAG: hypothetical protein CMK09_04585 [Ponticaulis sp.]|nr:hypothetical protein [Ponticaulis sp.]|tara:strand:- start:62832 stop:65240 length:2409 start_codon:yes stop_codon:yes gene_type:complete